MYELLSASDTIGNLNESDYIMHGWAIYKFHFIPKYQNVYILGKEISKTSTTLCDR